MSTSEADRAYRAALGLPEGCPLPKTLGTVAAGGSTRGGRRAAARNSTKTSQPPRRP